MLATGRHDCPALRTTYSLSLGNGMRRTNRLGVCFGCGDGLILAFLPGDALWRRLLERALRSWIEATEWLAAHAKTDLSGVLAAAVPYLHLAVTVCGGWMMGKAALAANVRLTTGEGDAILCHTKLTSAAFYAAQILPQAVAWAETVMAGDTGLSEGEI